MHDGTQMLAPIARGSEIQVTIHARWLVGAPEVAIDHEALRRMPVYVTRYAQTLGVVVHAVGGADDHLHLVFDLPGDQTLDSIMAEIQRATARFLQDVLGQRSFQWQPAYFAESVGFDERNDLTPYVTENHQHHALRTTREEWESTVEEAVDDGNSVPNWLREAMP